MPKKIISQNTFAFTLFRININSLRSSIGLLEYSLKDSIDILSSGEEEELLNRDFLSSDNIDEAIDEQREIEFTFYNQLFVLLVSYLENYFEEIIYYDLRKLFDEIMEYINENNINTLLLNKLEEDLFNSTFKNRRIDKVKYIFDLLKINDNQKNEFLNNVKILFSIRDCIVHKKSNSKELKSKNINNFQNFNKLLENYDILKYFKKDFIKFDSNVLYNVIDKLDIFILEFDKHIFKKINA